MNEIDDQQVIEAMIRFGGSFAKALGEAARCADPFNLHRIKSTWPEYWREYTEAAKWLKSSNKITDERH